MSVPVEEALPITRRFAQACTRLHRHLLPIAAAERGVKMMEQRVEHMHVPQPVVWLGLLMATFVMEFFFEEFANRAFDGMRAATRAAITTLPMALAIMTTGSILPRTGQNLPPPSYYGLQLKNGNGAAPDETTDPKRKVKIVLEPHKKMDGPKPPTPPDPRMAA